MIVLSGNTTGEAVEGSVTAPEPGRLSEGSTPTVVPAVQVPAGRRTSQPSLKRFRSETFHFGVRSAFTATR